MSKKLVIRVIQSGLFIFVVGAALFSNSPKASAAITCNSYVNGFVQAQIMVKVKNGSNIRDSTHFGFTMTSSVPKVNPDTGDPKYDNRIDLSMTSASGVPLGSRADSSSNIRKVKTMDTATGNLHICPGPGGIGTGLVYDMTDSSNGNASLNCLGGYVTTTWTNPDGTSGSGNALNTASFSFSSPAIFDAPAGGKWSVATNGGATGVSGTTVAYNPAANKDLNDGPNIIVVYTYTLPPVTIKGVKADKGGTVGSSANFGNDTITLSGPSIATRTDSANPFGSSWNDIAGDGNTFTVSAANSKPSYPVLGSVWCDLTDAAASSANSCGTYTTNPTAYPGTGGHGGFVAGTSRQIGPLVAGHVYNWIWVYASPGPPTGSLSCSSNVLSGNATDADKAGALSISFYKDGQAAGNQIATGVTSTSSSGSFSANVSSYVPAGSTHQFYVLVKGVNNSGVQDGKDLWLSASCGSSLSVPCPNGDNLQPVVTLPDAPVPSRSSTGTSDQTGATTTPNQQYYKEIPNDLHILDAYDQYGGATHLNDAGQTGWQSTTWQASHDFKLNYNAYVLLYPYDDHQTTVSYEQKYAETHFYTSGSADYYTCNGGDTGPTAPNGDNGHPATCRHDYTGTADQWSCSGTDSGGGSSSTCSHAGTEAYWSCPTGYSHAIDTDSSCAATSSTTTPATTSGTAYYWTCNSGEWGGGYSSTCYYNGTPVDWTCYGNYGGGSSSDCWYFYTGQPWYNWHNDPVTPYASMPITNTTYGSTPLLHECFYRNFTTEKSTDSPSTDVTQVSFNNNENPTSVTINTRTAARFNLNHGVTSLRHGMGVNGLSYVGNYFIEHADGSVVPLGGTDSQSQNVGGSVYNDGGNAQTTYSTGPIAVSLPPLMVGDKICAQFTVAPVGGEVDEYSNIKTSAGGSVSSTAIPNDPTCSAPVQNEPYARFYGNDVLAGAVFDGGVRTCNASAGISTYNTGSGVSPGGSGGQFAAMSLGAIQQFASAFLRGAAPTANKGLTFANTTSGDGGSFGGACTKLPDFYGSKQPSGADTRALSAFGSFPFPTGNSTYSPPSGGSLSGMTIPTGSNVSIFVDGDVYITGDITYQQAGWVFDPTNRTTNVPSFYLIVRGNIDIAPGVTKLDGVYVAQPKTATTGGTIRTCSQASNAPFSGGTNFYDQCKNQLTVTGAFMAQDVKFDRSFSSLRHSVSNESPLPGAPGAHGCDPSGSPISVDCSAELFNFSPENYIGMPALQASTSAKKNSYDFITTLSPVL